MIYQHLFDRVDEPATARAGLIGAGQFGTPIITQAPIMPRLDLSREQWFRLWVASTGERLP